MDSEILTSLPMDDVSQSDFDHIDGDILLSECMPQLGSLLNANGFLSYDPNMTLAISEAGTSLAEMLQTESILLAAETQRRNRQPEPCSSTSSALQQLLTSDSITVPILGNSSSIVAKSQTHEHSPSKTSGGGCETMDAPKLAQALLQGSLEDTSSIPSLTVPTSTEIVSLAQILQTPNDSHSLVADAISHFASLPDGLAETGLNTVPLKAPVGSVGLCSTSVSDTLSMCDNSALDIGTFPLFNNDDGSSLFENGIAATDVGSLLEQFEEAANNFEPEPVCPVVIQPAPPSPVASRPEDVQPSPATQPPPVPVTTMQPAVEPTPPPPQPSRELALPVAPIPPPASVSTPASLPRPMPKIEPLSRRPSLVDPDSEVVKLLKAKRRVPTPKKPTPAVVPKPTPPSEIIQKIKASNKRKSAIMLADAVPARGDRGGRAVQLPDFTKKPKKPDALKTEPSQPVKVELSPFKLEEALLNYTKSEPNSACSSSGENSRSSSPVFGVVRKRQKISISQYKNRMKSRESSRESSPLRTLALAKAPEMRIQPASLPAKLSPTKAAMAPCATITNVTTAAKPSMEYFKLIADHDYCQNVLVSEEIKVKESASTCSSPAPRNINDMEVVEGVENTPKKSDVTTTDGKKKKNKNSVLKSLLLNSNLAEELKEQAEKDRVFTMRNMSCGKKSSSKDSLAVVAMVVADDERETEETKERYNRFASERDDLNQNSCKPKPEKGDKSSSSHSHRQYRSKRSPSPQRESADSLFDKLPDYYTALSVPNQPGAPKPTRSTKKLMDTSLPFRDRDPSPDRNDPTFDKLPAYHSCFTNSTKYDRGFAKDPLGLEADLEQALSGRNSAQSSRSQTPNLVISSRMVSRTTSRATSRAASPVSRATSRSPSRSFSRSRSHSRSRSRSPLRRSRRRRSRRISSQGARRRSCSSSSSGGRSRSRTRYHSSSSSSRSRSRSQSRRGRRRNRSRSHSQSRSKSWIKWQEQQRVKREEEKRQKIAERRIIYVGRIPNEFSRRELRQKFGRFGDIEEVSVHMREHGDNYGFVTFTYTCDAYAAIEKGNLMSGCENFDLCFGGRREFCKSEYADLDGNMEDDEEMGPVMASSSAPMDFDELLRQATQKLNKKH